MKKKRKNTKASSGSTFGSTPYSKAEEPPKDGAFGFALFSLMIGELNNISLKTWGPGGTVTSRLYLFILLL